jgi:hypothetical protein
MIVLRFDVRFDAPSAEKIGLVEAFLPPQTPHDGSIDQRVRDEDEIVEVLKGRI